MALKSVCLTANTSEFLMDCMKVLDLVKADMSEMLSFPLTKMMVPHRLLDNN